MATASALAARAWKQARDPSMALIITTGVNLVLRLGSNLALAHLLVPKVFGLLAITMLVATALALLSDTAAWISIVRKGSSATRDWLDQMWSLQALRGVVLCLISVPLGPIIAAAYHEPQLAWLLPVANISLLITGLESLQPFVQQRELRPGLKFKMQIATQVVGSSVQIVLALLWPTAWALVVGLLFGTATSTIMSHALARAPFPRPHLTRPFLRDQWKLASWLIVSTGLGFFGGQIDRLLFPAWFGINLFGVYSIALTLASALLMLGQGWADNVFMPAIAKAAQDAGKDAARLTRTLTRVVVVYAAAAAALLGGIGPAFFLALYPKGFALASVFIQILAVTTYATFLTYLHRRTFLYQGMIRLEVSIEATRLVMFLGALALGYSLGQHPTAIQYVGLYALVQVLVYAGLLVIGRIKRLVHFRDDVPGHLAFLLIVVGMTVLDKAVGQRFGPATSLLTCGAIGAIIFLLVAARLGLPKLPTATAVERTADQEGAVPLDPVGAVQT
jgi:O-antigen/teichoic acid export membrane protein